MPFQNSYRPLCEDLLEHAPHIVERVPWVISPRTLGISPKPSAGYAAGFNIYKPLFDKCQCARKGRIVLMHKIKPMQQKQIQQPSAAFIVASWFAFLAGTVAFIIGLWNAGNGTQ